MVDEITISPQAAANAGCTATFALVDSYTYGSDWGKTWRFTATPAQGWVFDHWEVSQTRSEVGPGGHSGSSTTVDESNPSGWHEEYYYDYSYIGPSWGVWSLEISNVVAVFKRPHVPTNLILRSAASGQILHGASGTILHDA